VHRAPPLTFYLVIEAMRSISTATATATASDTIVTPPTAGAAAPHARPVRLVSRQARVGLLRAGACAVLLIGAVACGNRSTIPDPDPVSTNSHETSAADEQRRALDRAHTELANQRYQNAIDRYTIVLDQDPEVVEALVNRAIAHLAIDARSAALEDASEAFRLDPGEPRVCLNLALIQTRIGLSREALLTLDHVVGDPVYRRDALQARVINLIVEELHEQAHTEGVQLIEEFGESPDTLNHIAIALQELENDSQAIAFYERALGIDPDHADALRNLALLLIRQGRDDEGRQYLERYTRVTPANAIDRPLIQSILAPDEE